ncbi:Gfo/Idh/MocA family oxidoreductase [Clostridium sp. Sa3CUN1]|uniref:Gfo/Idh/MocA family oxidoreductase n=1 Tax=Clostridium gallinarum TaxID=2762246 RepID=A0ABR8Q4V0_9CLOT|nr:Gfo/Idh/MocA family oxidoreductase [Clostridium gallinarum]MBD7915430.1 Gfo/Idh/MocA family oxidoreductase [Clostridium gallinarum]
MINIGIVGTNFITDRLIEGAKLVSDAKISAVYSRSEEKGKEFAEKHNIEYVFTSLEEMAKSDVIDAVYIASPNSLHASQAILFLNNKKHVLGEKAFASNTKEVDEMIKAAKENNVVLMEAMKSTLLPNFKVVKDNLYKIGKVRKYFASYCQYSSRYDKYKAGEVLNAFKNELSNGALMDIGVYCIAPMVNLFGKPKTIKANGIMLKTGVDGEGSVLFGYDDMEAAVIYSKISNSYLPSEIQGEEGSIIIDRINTFDRIKIIYRDGREEDLSLEHEEANMCYEVQEFVNLIKSDEKESKVNSLKNSRDVIEVIEEARKQIGVIYPADRNNG